MKKNLPLPAAPASSIHYRLFLALLAGGSTAFSQTATIQNIVAPGTPFSVTALNANGLTTGYFFNSESSQRVFIWSNGAATDLGTLGGSFSAANAINRAGTVVGFSALPLDSEFHAFRTDGVSLTDLGTLGGFFSSATAVSDAGHIVGDSSVSLEGNEFHAYLLSPNGTMLDLGTLGGSSSTAYGVNSSGTVIGNSTVAGDASLHAFLYDGVTMLDLGTLGGASSSAIDINAAGQVVGDSTTASDQTRAFLFTGGAMVDLGTLSGSYSSSVGLNDAGVVIGNSTTADDAESHGFVYQTGAMIDLGSLGGGTSSAKAINNRNQVVGNSVDANSLQRAFLWENGVMVDLNTLLPANSNWELTSARFINDNQQVVGEGLYEGQAAWYLLSLADGEIENRAPVASAGNDQVIMCNGLVTLDGSASNDPDGDDISFEWFNGNVSLGTQAILEVELPRGTHTLTLRVSDARGASSEDSVTVVVSADTLPPVVLCPNAETVGANGRGRAPVPNFLEKLVASDNCTATSSLMKRQSPAPGTSVKCGTHPVTVTVTDASGNITTCSTVFNVVDVTPPVIRYPEEIFRRARTNCQAAVPNLVERVKATDNCTPANQLLITQEPAVGTLVEVGTHNVQVTATDLAGNSSVENVRLVVADVAAPSITSVTSSHEMLRPVDGRMVPVTLSVVATDNCDPNPVARIVSVVSSQPTTGVNDTTTPDWVVTGDLTLSVRAENSSLRAARVYFVLVAISDASGNTTYRSVWIRVPRN
jgi:probable HAF family extracellular repeat protein